MGVHDVDVAELQSFESGLGAFDEVLAREAEIINFGAGSGECGGVCAPVDLGALVLLAASRVVVIMRNYFCGHDDVVSIPAEVLDCAAHDELGFAAGVAFGAVEEVDAAIERGFEACEGVLVADVAAVLSLLVCHRRKWVETNR
jgi:hypothetical protein